MDCFPHVNEARFDAQENLKGEINPLLMTLLLEKQQTGDGEGKESSASFKGCGKLFLPKDLATTQDKKSAASKLSQSTLKSVKERLANVKEVNVRAHGVK